MISPIFKYIFAVIAGGIFLIFFVNLAGNIINTGNIETSAESVQRLINTLNAYSTAENANEPLELPFETTFLFDCNRIQIDVSKDNTKAPSQDSKHVIFAPFKLKGKVINMWTKQYSINDFMPITNFFYFTNSDYRYILVYDSQSKTFVEDLYNSIPKTSLNKKVFDVLVFHRDSLNINEIRKASSTFEEVKFIYFTSPLDTNLPNQKVIKIEPKEQGQIIFEDGTASQFLGKEMILGAIFSDDAFQYECSLELLKDKIKGMSKLYLNKITLSKQKNQACDYTPISNTLQAIQTADLAQLKEKVELLEQQNDRLLEDENCIAIL